LDKPLLSRKIAGLARVLGPLRPSTEPSEAKASYRLEMYTLQIVALAQPICYHF
jgi:hypothetical protein